MRSFFPKQRLSYNDKKEDDFAKIKTFVNSIVRYHEEDFCYDCKDGSKDELDNRHWQHRRLKNMLSNYRLYNNQLDQEDFREYCDSLGIKKAIGAVAHDIKPYNKTYNKINVLLGEEYKRPDNQRVVLVNAEGIKSKIEYKNKLYRESIQAAIQAEALKIKKQFPEIVSESYKSEEEYQAAMQEQDQQVQQLLDQAMDPEQIEKYMTETYLDQKEILAGDLLNYLYYKELIKEKKNDGFKHGLISGEEHVWVGIVNGEPKVEVLNPLKVFYHKSPEIKYIQDGLYAGYRTFMTIGDVFDKFSDDLTDTQKDLLEERYSSKIEGGNANLISPSMKYGDQDTYEYKYAKHNLLYSQYGSYGPRYYDDIEVIHIEWVSQRKIGFLSYTDEEGMDQMTKVDESFKVPRYAKKCEYKDENNNPYLCYEWDNFSLEWEWIPEVWEATRIDADIFVNIGPKPNQHYSLDNPYSVKLGYYGVVYNNMNATSQAIMDRMKPYQYLFFIAMDRFKSLIAKDKGALVGIDVSRLDPKFPIEKTIHFLEQSGYYVYNGLQGADNPGANTRPGVDMINASNMQNILNFAQILAYFDEQIGDAAGITKQREGGSAPYEAVTNNQQSIMQSSHITEPTFMVHDSLWREVKTGLIEVAEVAYSKKPLVTQFVLNDGSRKILEIGEELFKNADYGIFVSDNAKDFQVFQELRQLSQPLLQNDKIDIDDLVEILNADSMAELKRELKSSKRKREKREEAMQQSQQQSQEKQIQMQLESKEDEQAHEKELAMLKAETDITVAQIAAERFAKAQDVNENNIPDMVEVAKLKMEQDHTSNEAEKDRKHEATQAEKDRQVELAKIQAQKQIARMKPKPSKK